MSVRRMEGLTLEQRSLIIPMAMRWCAPSAESLWTLVCAVWKKFHQTSFPGEKLFIHILPSFKNCSLSLSSTQHPRQAGYRSSSSSRRRVWNVRDKLWSELVCRRIFFCFSPTAMIARCQAARGHKYKYEEQLEKIPFWLWGFGGSDHSEGPVLELCFEYLWAGWNNQFGRMVPENLVRPMMRSLELLIFR